MQIIQVEALQKKYGDFEAVSSIDFSVMEGEIFGFLGPNGAGKTTTINMLTGLARPTSGTISYLGEDYTQRIKAAQNLMGIVPDESNLYDEMDGFDNLCFCGALYGMEKARREERARELLRDFHLEKVGRRPFKKYSRGMKRKLTIAAAIIHHPRILFLDETTTGLDVVSAREIRGMIQELNQNGTTIFLTTHYIEEAEKLCHRIAFIVNGRIVRFGTLDALMKEDEGKTVVQLTLNTGALAIKQQLEEAFSRYRIDFLSDNSVKIYGQGEMNLTPLMGFFEEQGLSVYEAKVLRPSLEDVFVKVTGVKIMEMARNKGGRRK